MIAVSCNCGQDDARSAVRDNTVTTWRYDGSHRSFVTPWDERGGARGGRTPPGHGRCSFVMRRNFPARNTLSRGLAGCKPWALSKSPPCKGGSLARHCTYAQDPTRERIARRYRSQSHAISLLPDCLAALMPGELDTLEAVVVHGEPRLDNGRYGQCAAQRCGRAPGEDAPGRTPSPSSPEHRRRRTSRTPRPMIRRDGHNACAARDRYHVTYPTPS